MKTIFGFFSAAFTGAIAQNIAATANTGQTIALNLGFMNLLPSIPRPLRLLRTLWLPPGARPEVIEMEASARRPTRPRTGARFVCDPIDGSHRPIRLGLGFGSHP